MVSNHDTNVQRQDQAISPYFSPDQAREAKAFPKGAFSWFWALKMSRASGEGLAAVSYRGPGSLFTPNFRDHFGKIFDQYIGLAFFF